MAMGLMKALMIYLYMSNPSVLNPHMEKYFDSFFRMLKGKIDFAMRDIYRKNWQLENSL